MQNNKLDKFLKIMQKALEINSNDEKQEDIERFMKSMLPSAKDRETSSGPQKSVFVVVTHYMNGTQAEQVFATKQAAEAYIKSRSDEGGTPTIQEFPILGKIDNAGFVYPAEVPEQANDNINLKGIYGNYDDAKKVAGEHAPVAQKEIRKYKGDNHAG